MSTDDVPNTTDKKVACPCGWSRMPLPGESVKDALRYHSIQVHNNVSATLLGKF